MGRYLGAPPPPNETQSCGGPSAGDSRERWEDGEGDRMEDFVCPYCYRSFRSKIELGVHEQRMHPAQYNERIEIATRKPRWTDEETKVLARLEAEAPADVKAINMYLFTKMDGSRSIEAIKGIRRKQEYRNLVVGHRRRGSSGVLDCTSRPVGESGPSVAESLRDLTSGGGGSLRAVDVKQWLADKRDDIIPEVSGGIWIRTAICRVLEGRSPNECLDDWWQNMFPDLVSPEATRRRGGSRVVPTLSKRKARRREYRRMQGLWTVNMTKAAHKVLDGDVEGLPHPTLQEQVSFWRPVMEGGGDVGGRRDEGDNTCFEECVGTDNRGGSHHY